MLDLRADGAKERTVKLPEGTVVAIIVALPCGCVAQRALTWTDDGTPEDDAMKLIAPEFEQVAQTALRAHTMGSN